LGFIEQLHSGRASLIYGYSGTAQLVFGIEGKIWVISLDDASNSSAGLEIDGVSSSDPYILVARALGNVSGFAFRKKINDAVFFVPNDNVFLNQLFNRILEEKNRNLVTKIGANVNVTKELINKCVVDKYTEILFAPDLSARKERGEGKPLYVKVKDLGDGIEKVVIIALWLRR
jgi:hypothetical protein